MDDEQIQEATGVSSQESPEEIARALEELRRKGVKLWVEDGALRFKAPKGALTANDMEFLRVSKARVLPLIELVGDELFPLKLEPRPSTMVRAPLAFSQMAHWNLYRLAERPSYCIAPSVIKIDGVLNLQILKSCIDALVNRHEALRTRIVVSSGIPMQEVRANDPVGFALTDLSALPEFSREAEVIRLVEAEIQRPVQVAKAEALFAVKLMKLTEVSYVLILSLEHIVTDGFSLGVLVNDLFTAYRQVCAGIDIHLSPVPIQLADYAWWQNRALEGWKRTHFRYFETHLNSCPRLRFPREESLEASSSTGWGIVRFMIDSKLSEGLRERARLERTTPVLAAFSAFVVCVLRWCGVSDGVLAFQIDGRFDRVVERTVGYFASPLYFRIALSESDDMRNVVKRITQEYCDAHEHADHSYMESMTPRPPFTHNSCFNWTPRWSRGSVSDTTGEAVKVSRFPLDITVLEHLNKDSEPMMGLVEIDEGILGLLNFPQNKLSRKSMERFSRNYLALLTSLIEEPDRNILSIAFSQAGD